MKDDQINTVFDPLEAGEAIRSVLDFRPGETMTINTLAGRVVSE